MSEVKNESEENGISSMKLKIVSLLVLLAVGLSLFASGCTGPGNSQVNESTGQEVEIAGTDEPIIVAVSVLPQAEFVEKVGGNKVKTVVIIPPGADPHTYEPSPRELGEVSKARMYVTVGVDMPFEKVWIDRFETINSGTLIVNSSDGIELKELAATITMKEREKRNTQESLKPIMQMKVMKITKGTGPTHLDISCKCKDNGRKYL